MYIRADDSSEQFMLGCQKKGMNCARIYFDTCFEVKNYPTIDCLFFNKDQPNCLQTNLEYSKGDTLEDNQNAIGMFFANEMLEVLE